MDGDGDGGGEGSGEGSGKESGSGNNGTSVGVDDSLDDDNELIRGESRALARVSHIGDRGRNWGGKTPDRGSSATA